MGKIVENFLKELLEKEELTLPAKLLRHEILEELDRKLRTGSPAVVANFYKKLPEMIDFSILDNISSKLEEGERDIPEDDRKIIEFFVGEVEGRSLKDFMDVVGVLINILTTVEELERYRGSIPKNVAVSTMLWVYLNMYETTLEVMSQELKNYYSSKEPNSSILKKIEEITDKGQHLMAGEVEKRLIDLGVLKSENSSILSGSESRFFRNKLGHANLYFDDKMDELALTNGSRYTLEEFKNEFQKLYSFLLEWLFFLNDKESDIRKTVERITKKEIEGLSRKFKWIERAGYRREFNKIVFKRAE